VWKIFFKKQPLGRIRRWEVTVKIDQTEMEFQDMKWIELVQDNVE
jgi:hypothetical protein